MAQVNQVEEMEGVEKDTTVEAIPLFTEQEQRVLDLYDRLEELQLEIALLKSQGTLSQGNNESYIHIPLSYHHKSRVLTFPDEPDEVSDSDVKTAQQELLQAKTAYQLRNNIVENVLIANPILKAVHSGNNASIAEQ